MKAVKGTRDILPPASAVWNRVEAVYTVAPGADVGSILLRFGADADLRDDGTLRILAGGPGKFTRAGAIDAFVENKPVLYQFVRGGRTKVKGGFRKSANGLVGFWAADYDHSQPLVIDPTDTG